MTWRYLLFDRRFKCFKFYFSIFDLCLVLGFAYYVFFEKPSSMYQLLILGFSVVLHEIAHGLVAYWLGDPTAKNLGRLSVNPLVHVDPLGTVILPGVLLVSGAGFLIGWAKPVPIDTRYFKKPSRDMMIVAIAGPLTNVFLALFAVILFRGYLGLNLDLTQNSVFILTVLQYAVVINLVLAVFNLIPIPPLDGSRILAFFLSQRLQERYMSVEPYGFLIILALSYFDLLSLLLQAVVGPFLRLFLGF